MSREREHHRQAVGVVAGAVEPGVGMRVDDDRFIGAAAWNRPQRAFRGRQVGSRLGLERSTARGRPLSGGALRSFSTDSRNSPSRPPMLKHGPPQFAEVARELVARQPQRGVKTADGAALEELLSLRTSTAPRSKSMCALRDRELHGDLAL